MNFYEYHQPGEALDDSPVYLAAKDLIANGMQVIPLEKGKKGPANTIKQVYEIISKPIHASNMDFFFKDREVDLGIIMDHNMEFIDVDPKNKPGVAQSFLHALQSGWPELYDKLVIDFTPSGGCHVIYRSEVIGGKSSIAKVKASPNPLTIIERISRHNKQYIKISPSEGYELKQHNPFEIPFITAEERNFISAIAASFNEIIVPEVKKAEAIREDSPWVVFNSTHDWKWMRNELVDKNWTVYADRENKVLVKRPGDSSQQYSGIIYKDTNTLFLFTSSSEFANEKPYSAFGVYAMFYHETNIGAAMRQLASEGCGKNIFDEGQFWKKEKTKYEIKYVELLTWLHSIGYRMYNKTVVQVINNIVEISDENQLKRAFINEVEFEVQDKMFEKVSTIFAEGGGLMAMLNELEDNFINDGAEHTWLFFKNLAIKITPNGFEPNEYRKLEGYIWKSDIIDREFYEADYQGCDAKRFVDILGDAKAQSLQEIIGYCISRYKDSLNPRAVVLMEDIDPEDEGESQGGSGKGLLFNFIKQFRKSTDFDGKNFRPADPFLYQNVDPDTSLIFIDDVEKNFRFNSLFSILTGSLQINKKNKPQVIVPFERSPKVVITSNYSVGAMDNSSMRRKYEFAVRKYFGESREPRDEFGRQFFNEWDRAEWLRFDNFMAACCKLYLAASDKRSIGNITAHSAERSLISNTNREFIEYMDDQLTLGFFDFAPVYLKKATRTISGKTYTNAVDVELWQRMNDDPDYYLAIGKEAFMQKVKQMTGFAKMTTTRLTYWMKEWSKARGVEIDTSYKRNQEDGRSYRITYFPADFDKNKGGHHNLEVGNSHIEDEEAPF
jgi:hypothetical protein